MSNLGFSIVGNQKMITIFHFRVTPLPQGPLPEDPYEDEKGHKINAKIKSLNITENDKRL